MNDTVVPTAVSLRLGAWYLRVETRVDVCDVDGYLEEGEIEPAEEAAVHAAGRLGYCEISAALTTGGEEFLPVDPVGDRTVVVNSPGFEREGVGRALDVISNCVGDLLERACLERHNAVWLLGDELLGIAPVHACLPPRASGAVTARPPLEPAEYAVYDGDWQLVATCRVHDDRSDVPDRFGDSGALTTTIAIEIYRNGRLFLQRAADRQTVIRAGGDPRKSDRYSNGAVVLNANEARNLAGDLLATAVDREESQRQRYRTITRDWIAYIARGGSA